MVKFTNLHAFKIKLTQELKPLDHLKRRNFSNCTLAKLEENKEFNRKIIFSDEAHLWLNGFVNKQNMPRSSPLEDRQRSSISLPRQKICLGLLPWKIDNGLPSLSLARRSA